MLSFWDKKAAAATRKLFLGVNFSTPESEDLNMSQLIWLCGCLMVSSALCFLSLHSTPDKPWGQAHSVVFNEAADNGLGAQERLDTKCHVL